MLCASHMSQASLSLGTNEVILMSITCHWIVSPMCWHRTPGPSSESLHITSRSPQEVIHVCLKRNWLMIFCSACLGGVWCPQATVQGGFLGANKAPKMFKPQGSQRPSWGGEKKPLLLLIATSHYKGSHTSFLSLDWASDYAILLHFTIFHSCGPRQFYVNGEDWATGSMSNLRDRVDPMQKGKLTGENLTVV